jgi:predicted nicotinamide N-methyase
LSRFLVQSKHIRPGLSVLEIGCGLALPGIVAGKLGAQVTLSDYLPEALEFARHNWRRNLDTPARAQLMDWRHPDPRLAADVVLASDVAYEKRAFPHLPHAFRALCKPGGMVIVSEPGRDVARPFFEALPSRGFFVEKHSVEGQFRTLRYSVQVYVLTSGIRL